MPRESFKRSPEEQMEIVLIDHATMDKAVRQIVGCAFCSSSAGLPFNYVLDQVTGNDPNLTHYIFEIPAACKRCGAPITEKTLVEPKNAEL